MKLRLDFNWKM